MYHVKTLNKISPVGLAVLDPAKYTISDECETPDAILLRSAKMHDYAFNPELLCIGRAGAGVNNIPLDRCSEAGIVVFNTPGANARAVMELVLCGMLMASRDVPGGMNWLQTIADDPEVAAKVEKGKSQFVGPEILGKTLGVIGMGAIGYQVANAAVALGMTVYGYDPHIKAEFAEKLSPEVQMIDNLDEIYSRSDYLSLHAPVNDKTRGMINEAVIAKMKDGARIINMARAELVADDDLLAALKRGKIARYVTDFPNSKTVAAEGVIAIPHLGASTPESEDNCALMAAEQTRAYLEHGNIKNSVNMPGAYLAPGSKVRLTVLYRKAEDIPALVAELGIQVAASVTESRGDYAYSIFDLAAPADAAQVEQIRGVEGVLRVRVIG